MHASAVARSCALLLLALPVLAGCTGESADVVDVAVIGAPADPFERGIRLSTAGRLVRGATSEGLVALDAQGQVIPAVADRWIVTDDGLSYIFRLRDGVWADGSAITGESVRTALRQALKALAGTTLARDLDSITEIRAMAGRVVEVRLARPMPDLLQILAQPELGLLRNGRGVGPMALQPGDGPALLLPVPPSTRGLPEPPDWKEATRALRLHAVRADAAIRSFTAGDVAVVLGGRFENYPLAQAAGGLTQRTVRLDRAPGLFGLVVVRAEGMLAAPEVREALASAIDRDALAAALNGSTMPITRIVPTAFADTTPSPAPASSELWTNQPLPARRAAAARRIARWRAAAPEPLRTARPSLTIGLPDGPGADLLFARLATDFSALDIDLRRQPDGTMADLRLLDSVARYSRAEWFLSQLSCAARRGACSPAADALLAQANAAATPELRATLLGQAEAELTAANVFLPLGTPVRWSLARERVTGFSVNTQAYHPLLPLAVRAR